jgi:hypothetical protein
MTETAANFELAKAELRKLGITLTQLGPMPAARRTQ